MIEWMYQFLSGMGYTHPVHPVFTHVVIGNIVAALIFGGMGLYSKNKGIGRASYYTAVLAFVFLCPVIFLGVTDWIYFYDGAWLTPIKIKIVLTVILAVLMLLAVVSGRNDEGATRRGTFLSFLCILIVIGLGYYGAELVYSRDPAGSADLSKNLRIGQKIYIRHCISCHPHDENRISPSLGSIKLSDLKTFIDQIRNPLLPNGEKGVMPAFAASTISDKQAKALYEYIKALEKETIRQEGSE